MLNPRYYEHTVLHGLLLKLLVHVWGGTNDRLSIYMHLFDYKFGSATLYPAPPSFSFATTFCSCALFCGLANSFTRPASFVIAVTFTVFASNFGSDYGSSVVASIFA